MRVRFGVAVGFGGGADSVGGAVYYLSNTDRGEKRQVPDAWAQPAERVY